MRFRGIQCDRCGRRVESSSSPPTGWGFVNVDPPGAALDVCDECLPRFVAAIEKVLKRPLEAPR